VELNALAGLDLLPTLPASVKDVAMTLPEPRRNGERYREQTAEKRDRSAPRSSRDDGRADRTGSLESRFDTKLGRFMRDLQYCV
jgi:hypothetical protein